jgi:hypothetical protein
MQTRNPHPMVLDSLLDCRVAMLGLDLGEIESRGGELVDTLKWRCTSCDFREACELDLKRDPNDPVWETYCPNTATLIALTQA